MLEQHEKSDRDSGTYRGPRPPKSYTERHNNNKNIDLSGEIRSHPHVHIPITAPRHETCMTSFLEAWKEKQEKY